MFVAWEFLRAERLTSPLIPIEDMVEAFPHTATPAQAEAMYGQASAMLRLLRNLCRGAAHCGLPALVQALLDRTATPEGLFEWAVRQSAGNLVGSPAALLESYIQQNFSLEPELRSAIARRREQERQTSGGESSAR